MPDHRSSSPVAHTCQASLCASHDPARRTGSSTAGTSRATTHAQTPSSVRHLAWDASHEPVTYASTDGTGNGWKRDDRGTCTRAGSNGPGRGWGICRSSAADSTRDRARPLGRDVGGGLVRPAQRARWPPSVSESSSGSSARTTGARSSSVVVFVVMVVFVVVVTVFFFVFDVFVFVLVFQVVVVLTWATRPAIRGRDAGDQSRSSYRALRRLSTCGAGPSTRRASSERAPNSADSPNPRPGAGASSHTKRCDSNASACPTRACAPR